MSETETDQNERPLNPHYIKSTHILNNPFDDIVPRNAEKPQKEEKSKEQTKKKKSKAKAHKKLTVLSFGDEAEEEEKTVEKVNKEIKSKSAHDLVDDEKMAKQAFKPEQKHEDDHKWISKRVDGDVELEDTDDLASWMRYETLFQLLYLVKNSGIKWKSAMLKLKKKMKRRRQQT